MYKRICQWFDTENQVHTPRTAEDEEQLDREPEQLTLISHEQQTMPQAPGNSLLQLTENHETPIRRGSEQAAYARTVEHVQFHITHESVMDGNSSTLFRQRILNSQSSRLQAVLTDQVKI